MAPAGQGTLWSEVLCCPICSHLFGAEKLPVNLACGHAVCRPCLFGLVPTRCCPLDQTAITVPVEELPVNAALLSILGVSRHDESKVGRRSSPANTAREHFRMVEAVLLRMSTYLRRAESERGGSVWSEELSRPVQRKLLALLCFQLLEEVGRQRVLKTARALAERILSELVVFHQSTAHLSSNLWAAVRARGCQFLGPAMQEEVLRLILLTLSEGALIARKTLVMYIVQTLCEDYPQVSKTCVGHVVQLLYRASCFNVLKRDGESSLMQLKSEFRDYESLRREHDAQIVQVAIEAGLRVSPDQWSSLLYGDQSHRSHMQSIIDKLQSPQAYGQLTQELQTALQCSNDPELMMPIIKHFERVASVDAFNELPCWPETLAIIESLGVIVDAHVRFTRKRNEQRLTSYSGISRRVGISGVVGIGSTVAPLGDLEARDRSANRRYKTRLCRDAEAGRSCPRGDRCTYAHSQEELRRSSRSAGSGTVPQRIGGRIPDMVSPPATVSQFSPPQGTVVRHSVPPTGMTVVTALPPPSNQAPVMVDPRQAIAAENGSLMPLALPVAPVVIQGAPVVEPPNAVPVPLHVQNQISNGRFEPVTEQITQPGVVMMVAAGNALPGNGQPMVMQATVWQSNPPPHAVNGPPAAAAIPRQPAPSIIPIPVAAQPPPPPPPPPSQMHIDPNTVRWMPSCGNGQLVNDPGAMHYNVPVECLSDRFWRVSDDGCCAVPFGAEPLHPMGTTMGTPAVVQCRNMRNGEFDDEEQLMMRRREIITRLAALQQRNVFVPYGEETVDDEDLQSHVSYTVANSVLFEDKEAVGMLQLPPIPFRYNAAPHDENVGHVGEVTPVSTTVLTVCPPLMWTNGTKPATVQSPCTIMQVKDTIKQPLPTPAIQRPHMVPLLPYDDPLCIASGLPTVIRQLPAAPSDPQNVVSATLDRIVDVKERINEVEKNGGLGCSVEKQQLNVELNIVSRQIQSLDQQTKQSCLLRELEEVDKKIEHLNIHC